MFRTSVLLPSTKWKRSPLGTAVVSICAVKAVSVGPNTASIPPPSKQGQFSKYCLHILLYFCKIERSTRSKSWLSCRRCNCSRSDNINTVLRVAEILLVVFVCVNRRYKLGPEVLVVLRGGTIIIYVGSTVRGSSIIDWRRIGRIKVCPSDPVTKRVLARVTQGAPQTPLPDFSCKGVQTKEWNMKEDRIADLLHKAVRVSKAAKWIKGRFIDRVQKPSNANSRWSRQDSLLTVRQWMLLETRTARRYRTCARLCSSVSDTDCIGWQVNHELERMWKEAGVARFDVMHRHLPGGNEENKHLSVCGTKMPTRCNRGFYCRSYCLLNMFRGPLCPPSAEGYVSGLQDPAASCKPNT